MLDHTMDILRLMDEGLARDEITEKYNFNPDLVSICFDAIRQNQWATEDSNHKFSITEKGRGLIEFYVNRQLQEKIDHSVETKKFDS
jgi:predicted transcriptional regulator